MPNVQTVSCELSNIIYFITCKICKLQYIGETGRPLRQRIYEHIYSITKAVTKDTPVSRHFHAPHHGPNDLVFHIIEDCNLLLENNDPTSQCKRRELFWIWTLKTIHPYGISMAIWSEFHLVVELTRILLCLHLSSQHSRLITLRRNNQMLTDIFLPLGWIVIAHKELLYQTRHQYISRGCYDVTYLWCHF
jgi:hypothetical protein